MAEKGGTAELLSRSARGLPLAQIALFVAPVLVFVSYLFGQPMDLEFTIPEVVAVIVAVQILSEISSDGETNWPEDAQLLSVYLILGILFYLLPEMH